MKHKVIILFILIFISSSLISEEEKLTPFEEMNQAFSDEELLNVYNDVLLATFEGEMPSYKDSKNSFFGLCCDRNGGIVAPSDTILNGILVKNILKYDKQEVEEVEKNKINLFILGIGIDEFKENDIAAEVFHYGVSFRLYDNRLTKFPFGGSSTYRLKRKEKGEAWEVIPLGFGIS